MKKVLFLILLSAFVSTAKRLSKEKVIYAITCGSTKAIKGSDGYLYQAVV